MISLGPNPARMARSRSRYGKNHGDDLGKRPNRFVNLRCFAVCTPIKATTAVVTAAATVVRLAAWTLIFSRRFLIIVPYLVANSVRHWCRIWPWLRCDCEIFDHATNFSGVGEHTYVFLRDGHDERRRRSGTTSHSFSPRISIQTPNTTKMKLAVAALLATSAAAFAPVSFCAGISDTKYARKVKLLTVDALTHCSVVARNAASAI